MREFVDFRYEWIAERYEFQQAIALLRVDVMNFSMYHPDRPVQLNDVLKPLPKRRKAAEPRKRMTEKRRQAVAHELEVMFTPFLKGS